MTEPGVPARPRGPHGGWAGWGVTGGLSAGSGCVGLCLGDALLCTPAFMAKTFVGGGNPHGEVVMPSVAGSPRMLGGLWANWR